MEYDIDVPSAQQSVGKSKLSRCRKGIRYLLLAITLGAALGVMGFFILGPRLTSERMQTLFEATGHGRNLDKLVSTLAGTWRLPTSRTSANIGATRHVGHNDPLMSAAVNSVLPMLERAPPAPPPIKGGRGGGGGGGSDDGLDTFITQCSTKEAFRVLADWIAQARIYRMSGDFGGSQKLARIHTKSVEKLEALHTFLNTSTSSTSRTMMGEPICLGLYEANWHEAYDFVTHDTIALAGAYVKKQVSETGQKVTLTVYHSVVKPAELSNEDCMIPLRMKIALRAFAEDIDVNLITAPLDGLEGAGDASIE